MKIAVCFSGFNRDVYLKRNLKTILNKCYFKDEVELLDIYYKTYNIECEWNNKKTDFDKIRESCKNNGIDNIYIESENYEIKYFLKIMKQNNIPVYDERRAKSYPTLNRFLSSMYNITNGIKMINKKYDYIFIMRNDCGIDGAKFKNKIINLKSNEIICQCPPGNRPVIDPRFIVGKFDLMKKFSNLFEYSLKKCVNDRTVCDHRTIYKFITEELKVNTIPITEYIDLGPCKTIRLKLYKSETIAIIVQTREYKKKILNIYNNL
tara:strand:+ start:9055 stop:9846 length:792 start_codon:yes stop_codon:yes gene_type:complete